MTGEASFRALFEMIPKLRQLSQKLITTKNRSTKKDAKGLDGLPVIREPSKSMAS